MIDIDSRPSSPVNLRSVLLALVAVVFICALTPYNDFAVNNTYLVGHYLPTGPLLFFTLFVIAINGPLRRWRPQRAFGSGELAVALGMTLVACALPSSGLMRYLPTMLVVLWYHAGGSGELQSMLRQLDLPQWMFPTMNAPPTDVAARANDPVIQNYWGRVPIESDTFVAHVRA